jgi:hypothetical protein
MSFASGNELHFEKPLENTPFNLARGRAVINGLREGGGTEMLAALQKALEFRKDPERLRIVLFMTDGFIGNDPEILAFTKEHLNNSRIFPLGVGSSPNRYLLEEMAVLGKGSVQYVRQNEKAEKLEKVIERFYDRISRPVLTDLSVDWNGLDVSELSPAFVPDLFAGQPLLLHARYNKAGSATVLIRGKLMGKPWKMPVSVNLPEKEPANGAMGTLWARSRITDLGRLNLRGENAEAKARIIELALAHKLVTSYTSFVAVDESPVDPKGKKPLLIPVESELPEGTQYEGFFGCASGSGGSLAGGSYAAAAVRGAFGQAKYARMASPASVSVFSMESAGGAASPREAKAVGLGDKVKALSESIFGSEDIVAGLALKLLENPTSRLLRQLVSRQEASGSFSGSEGRKTAAADQALALLALAKARAALGADADAAMRLAWSSLRRAYPAGTNGREAVVKALKGSPHWSSAPVQRELAALGATLEALK